MRLIAFAILVLALVVAVVGWRATSHHADSGSGRLCSPYSSDCGVPLPYAP